MPDVTRQKVTSDQQPQNQRIPEVRFGSAVVGCEFLIIIWYSLIHTMNFKYDPVRKFQSQNPQSTAAGHHTQQQETFTSQALLEKIIKTSPHKTDTGSEYEYFKVRKKLQNLFQEEQHVVYTHAQHRRTLNMLRMIPT